MQATDDTTVSVETPASYDQHSLDCESPINIYLPGASRQTVTFASQLLSLFIETHEDDPLNRLVRLLESTLDAPENTVVAIGEPADTPSGAWWPIVVEIEGIEQDEAEAVADAVRELATDGFGSAELATQLRTALIDATDHQPRSIVRKVKNDGSRYDALEWHTDTDAALDTE